MSVKEEDRAIEAYRKQLAAEADLAAGDLDEIEDHLRSLTDDLRERGMPAGVAVAEAARRLGDPRMVAREHARVRSAFGTKLSRTRAWSAAALMVPMLSAAAYHGIRHEGLWSRSAIEVAFGLVLMCALVLRLSWARPILLGGLVFFLIPTMLVLATWPDAEPLWLVAHAGLIVFLAPWRRSELTRAGAGLALQVWAYAAASYALTFQYSSADGGYVPIAATAQVAFAAGVVATVGAVLRARWSTLSGLVAAVTLGVATIELSDLTFQFHHPDLVRGTMLSLLVSGVIAATFGSLLAWRSARSTFGSLRGIAS